MEVLGFKKITSENWNQPDETTVITTSPFDYDRGFNPYFERIMEPQLSNEVPIEIRRLFEVARATMVYSYYFYPFYTLASDQLFHIGEAALLSKARKIGYSKKRSTFKNLIECLANNNVIDPMKRKQWEALRELRNNASHRRDQSIYSPAMAIGVLEKVAIEINSLFSNESHS